MPKINNIEIELAECPQCGHLFTYNTNKFVSIRYIPEELLTTHNLSTYKLIVYHTREHIKCTCLACEYSWDIFHKNPNDHVRCFITEFSKITELTIEEALEMIKKHNEDYIRRDREKLERDLAECNKPRMPENIEISDFWYKIGKWWRNLK